MPKLRGKISKSRSPEMPFFLGDSRIKRKHFFHINLLLEHEKKLLFQDFDQDKCFSSPVTSHIRGSPIPLCKTESCKNIWPFHVSRIITKMFSRSRKNQGVYKTWARPWPGPWPTLWPTLNFIFLPKKEKRKEKKKGLLTLTDQALKDRAMSAMFCIKLIPRLFTALLFKMASWIGPKLLCMLWFKFIFGLKFFSLIFIFHELDNGN